VRYLVVAQGVKVEAVGVGARGVPQKSVAVLGRAERSAHHAPFELKAIHLDRITFREEETAEVNNQS
jgi:hypothetical protein